MTGFLSPTHILLLLVVVLLLFGAKRLPEFGRSLGSGMREFKESINPGSHHQPTALAAAPTPDRATGQDEVSEPRSVEQQTTPGGAPSPPAA
jgi:sec-independent protein translocase protein TatA